MVTVETMQSLIAIFTCSTFILAVLYWCARIDATEYKESCEIYRELWMEEMSENIRIRTEED